MLTKSGCRERVSELVERTRGECPVIVIADPRHIGYLTGFFTNPVTINVRSRSYLLVDADGTTTLITDNWQGGAAQAAHADAVQVFNWYDEEKPARERGWLAAQTLLSVLQSISAPRSIGVEANALPLEVVETLQNEFPGVGFHDVWKELLAMRRAKQPEEVECMRRAIRACEAGYAAVRRELRPGVTEFEAYAIAYHAALLEAGEPISAVGDFISGVSRTAAMGGPPTQRAMQTGELFIMDFFVLVNGYRADLCNTFVVGAEPSDDQRRYMAVLEKALAAAEEKLRAGTPTRDVYQAAVDVITAAGLSDGIWGHIGHGLGLDHPEAPFMVRQSDEVLRAGDVVTVEPGVYFKGWGGMRLEDDFLITASGCERLSNHGKGL